MKGQTDRVMEGQDGGVEGWTGRQTDRGMNRDMEGWKEKRERGMDRLIEALVGKHLDEKMDMWTDRQADGRRRDRQTD